MQTSVNTFCDVQITFVDYRHQKKTIILQRKNNHHVRGLLTRISKRISVATTIGPSVNNRSRILEKISGRTTWPRASDSPRARKGPECHLSQPPLIPNRTCSALHAVIDIYCINIREWELVGAGIATIICT